MSDQENCAASGCNVKIAPGTRNYQGKPYCQKHYQEALDGELNAEFTAWQVGQQPSERFKYLLGRISGERRWETEGGSYLTSARIRDRAYGFIKTEGGCVFHITRHPCAFTQSHVTNRVVQTWEANLSEECLRLVESRGWKTGDLDL